ncbi:MAG: sulfotransferase family 2 domain-containing protein [Mesonia sp.]|uniref:sulfotransferase family 2 domain-containing protein n=1 Tax=Mesonia sp. TaxID=1960830 RepID=UPI0032429F6B
MGYKRFLLQLLPKTTQAYLEDYYRRKKNCKLYDPEQYLSPKFESSFAPLDYYRCVFVHIPKNAGLSVCYTLFGNTGGSHRKITSYQKLFHPKTFASYFKFTFVRNPWDRLVSTYFFLKNGGLTEKDRVWAAAHLSDYEDFESFVKGWLTPAHIHDSLHFQPQYIFLEDETGKIAVDFIGRFERINEDFEYVADRLGIERRLKKTNTSKRKKNYQEYYNEETRAIVSSVYQRDIELFNYTF